MDPAESTRHLGRSAILYNRGIRGGAPRGSSGGGTLFSNSVVEGGGAWCWERGLRAARDLGFRNWDLGFEI